MYLIIEIHEREFAGAYVAKDQASAFEKANSLLSAYCEQKDMPELYIKAEDPCTAPAFSTVISLAGDGGTGDNAGAWANIKDEHWDAHVVSLDKDLKGTVLDMLLKDLCHGTMSAPDSGCGDGACDECPINHVLEMLQDSDLK